MSPTRRFDDRTGLARGMIEIVEPGIGVGLQDAGIAGQMAGRMFAAAIARVEEHRRRRRRRRRTAGRRAHSVHNRPVMVLPLASTGTVVSSPWRRSAASTCALDQHHQGRSAAVQAPTQSASVETLRSMPSHGEALALPVQRLMLAELAVQDRRQQVRAGAAARRSAWNGAGGWVIVSQDRQENFSRTVWITL